MCPRSHTVLDRCWRWAILPVGMWRATAQSSDRAISQGAPAGDEIYLWLSLACFGFLGFLAVGRMLLSVWRRRRRSRALRMFRTDALPVRPRRFLQRWWRGAPPRVVRLESWETRTRQAELRAQQAVAALRSELTPHLARMMKDRLVWTLMTQRARLLKANQANAEKVATLEHRLAAIQLQIHKQAQAYESRIAELEKELAEKSTVTRELLRFRVIMAKQALEAVRLDKA